jgi:acyl-CoA reductase-like NAD-dependent aldehyde dehydrogenase
VFNVVVSNANEAGAPTVKKTLLELGGKSAHVVLDDADFQSNPVAAQPL